MKKSWHFWMIQIDDLRTLEEMWRLAFWFLTLWASWGPKNRKCNIQKYRYFIISKVDNSCWTRWGSLWKHKIKIQLQIGFQTNCWDIFSFSIFMENAVFYLPRARQTDVFRGGGQIVIWRVWSTPLVGLGLNYLPNSGGALCVEIGFYVDIS